MERGQDSRPMSERVLCMQLAFSVKRFQVGGVGKGTFCLKELLLGMADNAELAGSMELSMF